MFRLRYMNEQSHVSLFRGLHRGGTYLLLTDARTKCKNYFFVFFANKLRASCMASPKPKGLWLLSVDVSLYLSVSESASQAQERGGVFPDKSRAAGKAV